MPIVHDGKLLIFGNGGLTTNGASSGEVAALSDSLDELAVEIRNGRAFYINGTEPTGSTIPEWADVVLQSRTADNTYTVWRPTTAPANGLETDTVKKSANGLWFIRLFDRDAREVDDALERLLRQGQIVRLNSVAGTENAITASLPADAPGNLTEDGMVLLIPRLTSTASFVNLTIGDVTRQLTIEGAELPVGRVQKGGPILVTKWSNAKWNANFFFASLGDLAVLEQEVRNGRVFYINGTDPSGSPIPDWADVVIQSRTANNTYSVWRPVAAPADGLETADLKKSSTNLWFIRLYNLEARTETEAVRKALEDRLAVVDKNLSDLVTEVRNGRTFYINGAEPPGAVIPDWADVVLQSRTSDNTFTIWRLVTAPADGLETADLKKSINGLWFNRLFSRDAREIGESVRTALEAKITALNTDLYNGRVHATAGQEPKAATIPTGTDLVIQQNNAANTFTVWRAIGAPADGLETADLQKSLDGAWWRRLRIDDASEGDESLSVAIENLTTEVRNGRVYSTDGATPSGLAIPTWADTVVQLDTSTGLFSIWRGVTAPAGGVETSILKKDSAGRWWALMLNQAAKTETLVGPNDSFILVDSPNGVALAVMGNGTTRGTFLLEDVLGLNDRLVVIETAQADLKKNVYNDAGVNDLLVLVQAKNGAALAVDTLGRTRGTFLAEDIQGLPGAGDEEEGAAVEFVDPGNQGEAWMSIKSTDAAGEVIRYMDRSWREAWGYEKRGTKTLAQTPNPAVGIIAFGGGSSGVVRPLSDTFPYHVIDETVTHQADRVSASAQAAAFLELEYAARRGLPTVVAITRTIGSAVEADALDGSTARVEVKTRVAAAAASMKSGWLKDMFFDRISLSLLEGAPQTLKLTADTHYAAVARGLRIDVADAAGQSPLPLVVVTQSAGTRTSGTSEVILAEGELDFNHFSLDFVVAGPRYPYRLQDGMPSTLTPEGALLMSELEAIAVNERLAKRDWFGPSIGAQCTISGSVITVPFTAMSNLILRDPVNHGFTVSGVTNGATIQSAAVNGKNVLLTMTAAPEGDLVVNYAWGQTGDKGDGFTANRGSLTDQWSQASRLVANQTHYRYGRAGRATVVR